MINKKFAAALVIAFALVGYSKSAVAEMYSDATISAVASPFARPTPVVFYWVDYVHMTPDGSVDLRSAVITVGFNTPVHNIRMEVSMGGEYVFSFQYPTPPTGTLEATLPLQELKPDTDYLVHIVAQAYDTGETTTFVYRFSTPPK